MKNKKGFFRKGWLPYSLISFFAIGMASLCFYVGVMDENVFIGFLGFCVFAFGGGLMRSILCYDYINLGEDKI